MEGVKKERKIEKSDEQVSRSEFSVFWGMTSKCRKEVFSFGEIVKGVNYAGFIQYLQNYRDVCNDLIKEMERDICYDRCFFSDKKRLISQLEWGSEAKKEKMLAKFESIQKSWEDEIMKSCLAELGMLRYEALKISEKIEMLNNEVSWGEDVLGDIYGCCSYRCCGDLRYRKIRFWNSYLVRWDDIVDEVNRIINKGESLKKDIKG